MKKLTSPKEWGILLVLNMCGNYRNGRLLANADKRTFVQFPLNKRAFKSNTMGKIHLAFFTTLLLSASAFAQQSCGTVTDFDGNTYATVQIGEQCWMKENLRTTHYADGTSISHGNTESFDVGYWYYPDDNSSNKATYGLLYNWKAVMRDSSSSSSNPSGVQGICPKGWHVPSYAEWTQLTDYVSSQSEYWCGGNSDAIAKALASTTKWKCSGDNCGVGNNPSTNNATGFSALPAGGYHGNFGYGASFWSSTYAGGLELYYGSAYAHSNYCSKDDGGPSAVYAIKPTHEARAKGYLIVGCGHPYRPRRPIFF